jgi:hypothetical protein
VREYICCYVFFPAARERIKKGFRVLFIQLKLGFIEEALRNNSIDWIVILTPCNHY